MLLPESDVDVVTQEWKPVEIFCGLRCVACTNKADVWSLGLMLLSLWFGWRPFFVEEILTYEEQIDLIVKHIGMPRKFKETLVNENKFRPDLLKNWEYNPEEHGDPGKIGFCRTRKEEQNSESRSSSLRHQTKLMPKKTRKLLKEMNSAEAEAKWDIIDHCLQIDPDQRSDMNEISARMHQLGLQNNKCTKSRMVSKINPDEKDPLAFSQLLTVLGHSNSGSSLERSDTKQILQLFEEVPLQFQAEAALILDDYLTATIGSKNQIEKQNLLAYFQEEALWAPTLLAALDLATKLSFQTLIYQPTGELLRKKEQQESDILTVLHFNLLASLTKTVSE